MWAATAASIAAPIFSGFGRGDLDDVRPASAHRVVCEDGPVFKVPLAQLVDHEEGDALAIELAGRGRHALQPPGPSLRPDLPAVTVGALSESRRQLAHQLGGVEDQVGWRSEAVAQTAQGWASSGSAMR